MQAKSVLDAGSFRNAAQQESLMHSYARPQHLQWPLSGSMTRAKEPKMQFFATLAKLVPACHACCSSALQVSYRLISMYNGSDSNMSVHTRFAKPLETLRTSHYPETYSIIHFLSPTWSAKPWNLSLTVSSRGNAPPTSS